MLTLNKVKIKPSITANLLCCDPLENKRRAEIADTRWLPHPANWKLVVKAEDKQLLLK